MKHGYFLLMLCLLTACLDEIDFESPEQASLLVVDGIVTNGDHSDEIRLSRTVEYGLQQFVAEREAAIIVIDEAGNRESLIEVEAGVYEFRKMVLSPAIGESYAIEIRLKNGEVYRSEMEKMAAVPEIDSLSFEISVEEFVNDLGITLDEKNLVVQANTTINQEDQSDLLFWEVEHIYSFVEPLTNPLQIPKVCYIEQALEAQSIPLLDGALFKEGANIVREVTRKSLDFSLEFRQSYRVFQYGISRSAYDYWSDLALIANPGGTIFDPIPAKIQGNVRNVNDAEELVLGYFGVASVTAKTLFITRADVSGEFNLIPFCSIIGTRNLRAQCFDCLLFEGSSLERPDYW